MVRAYKDQECIQCGELKKIAAKGLCRRCYGRLHRNGNFEKKRVRSICNEYGCDDFVVSNGLCDKHRKRFKRHGHTNQTRPSDWGKKQNHDLYHVWGWIKRECVNLGGWSDFLTFVEDVGDRPEGNYRLKRKENNLDWSKDNVHWV